VTRQVAEPETRIGGKRLFTAEDVERLARHFGVRPIWSALEAPVGDITGDQPAHLVLRPPFDICQVSETGHEVRDADGKVFSWTSDRAHALVLAGLLEAAARG
jgi:hypothetical protein